MPAQPSFVHLHVHSAYSLAEGAIQVKDLVKKAKLKKMPAIAVTDTNNLFGAMEFSLEASKEGLQPIIGAQVNLGPDGRQIVLLVQSRQGYLNLSALISKAFLSSDGMSDPYLEWDDLKEKASGLICLSGGVQGAIAQSILHRQHEAAEKTAKDFQAIFGDRFYMEIQRHGGWRDEETCEEGLINLAYKLNIPLVATNDAYFLSPDFYDAHDALLCIAAGRYITESDRRRVTPDHYLKSASEMEALFADLPEAIQNTVVIAQRCHFYLEPVKPILPAFEGKEGRTETEEMQHQSREGLEWRLQNFVYPEGATEKEKKELAKPYRERLEFELNTIIKMGFSGYFLIVSDFIKWAKARNIPVGPGRGSGAGSLVAWALKVTDLDPLKLDLLFERFLNPERVSMPDFDIDFCQDRRDEVIQYVQERYGHDRVAQIITFGKLQARAVLRDVGRVLQIPYGQVDRIAKMIPNNPAAPVTLAEALEQDADLQAERFKDENNNNLITIALQLEGLYRHASTHAAGLVIADRPLQELCPVYRDPRSTMPVTQFNMKYVEQTGLVKFDFLGLKTLTVIQKAVEMIADSGTELDILKIPLDDEKTYEVLSSGQSTAIFQLESSGMRDTLRKMKPNRFGDIIALVALYRPGPMDNIPKFISVKEGKEAPDYLHPKLQPMLEETYGIMVYQEQVMQAAQILSGYTLGGADLLRRAMGKKIKAEMDAQREAFVDGAKKTSKVPAGDAESIFHQIEKFAGYGFNKSHAAAYALVAYQTAWLKANYPVEFMAASMALDMGNTDKLAILKQAVDRMKIDLLPPDINASFVSFAVENNAIRYALAAVKGVGAQAMANLVAERQKNGPFKSLEDFLKRIDPKSLNKKQFENLVAAGAFDSIHPNRAQLFTAAEKLVHYAAALTEERNSSQVSLFALEQSSSNDLTAHHLPDIQDWGPMDRLSYEFQAIGFYLSAHPLDTKRAQLERLNIIPFAEVEAYLADRPVARIQMAGVVLKKSEKISAKSGNKYAFLTLSDASGVYEVTLFSEILSRSRALLEEGKALLLTVDAEPREDQIRMTVQDIRLLEDSLAHRVQEIRFTVKDPAAIDLMKQKIGSGQDYPGNANIIIYLQAAGRSVALKIPGRYSLPPALKDDLQRNSNLLALEEV